VQRENIATATVRFALTSCK